MLPENTVLTLDGQRHRERRQRLAPMFRGEALEAIAPVIRELAARQIEGWPVGTPFAVSPHARFLTLSVAARLILGVEDQACVQRLERHLRAALRPYSMLSGIDSLAHLGPISPQAAAERCRQAFARGLSEIIRCRPDHRAGDASRALGRLSADEVFALLLAGHETTATALAWAIELLSRAPEAADALARESSGPSRSWLDAVIWDTLRLRPPLVDIVRQPAEAELREILPQIVGRFVLTPVAAAQSPRLYGTALVPARGGRVVLLERQGAGSVGLLRHFGAPQEVRNSSVSYSFCCASPTNSAPPRPS